MVPGWWEAPSWKCYSHWIFQLDWAALGGTCLKYLLLAQFPLTARPWHNLTMKLAGKWSCNCHFHPTLRTPVFYMLAVYLNIKHGVRDCEKLTVLQVCPGHTRHSRVSLIPWLLFFLPALLPHSESVKFSSQERSLFSFFSCSRPLSSWAAKSLFPSSLGDTGFAEPGSWWGRDA